MVLVHCTSLLERVSVRTSCFDTHFCGVRTLGCIYIRAKVNAKVMSLLMCCIVSYLCVYTTAMSEWQKIKENYCFRFNFRSKINAPLQYRSHTLFMLAKQPFIMRIRKHERGVASVRTLHFASQIKLVKRPSIHCFSCG